MITVSVIAILNEKDQKNNSYKYLVLWPKKINDFNDIGTENIKIRYREYKNLTSSEKMNPQKAPHS